MTNTPDMRLVPVSDADAMRAGRAILDAHGQWELENNRVGGQNAWQSAHLMLLGRAALSTMRKGIHSMDALAASPSPSVGAVAWQVRVYGIDGEAGEWKPYDGPAPTSLRPGRTVEYRPLYLHPAPDASAVREGGDSLRNPVSAHTAELHPETTRLVNSFAISLAHKLLAAEKKYGYSDGWLTDDWEVKCRADLLEHVHKGDPLDVAAYAAFCWARGWSTAPALTPSEPAGREELREKVARLRDMAETCEGPESVMLAPSVAQEHAADLRAVLALFQNTGRG